MAELRFANASGLQMQIQPRYADSARIRRRALTSPLEKHAPTLAFKGKLPSVSQCDTHGYGAGAALKFIWEVGCSVIPGMSAWQLCKHIRRTTWGKKAWVYALTALRDADALARAQRAGFNGLLNKPLSAEELAQLFG